MSIEHGHLLDDATVKLMAEKDVWWSMHPFTDDTPTTFREGSAKRIKQIQVYNGSDASYALAKKYKVKLAWGRRPPTFE